MQADFSELRMQLPIEHPNLDVKKGSQPGLRNKGLDPFSLPFLPFLLLFSLPKSVTESDSPLSCTAPLSIITQVKNLQAILNSALPAVQSIS